MTTEKKYSWEEEYRKIECALYHYPHRYDSYPVEKQNRLLDRCLLLIQDSHGIPTEERAELLEFLDLLMDFFKDLYRLFRTAKDEGFYISELSQKITLNPFCRENKTEDDLAAMCGDLFNHKIKRLSYPEVFNIYLFIEDLFKKDGILDWLDFIEEWKKEISKECRFLDQTDLFRPIYSYFMFQKVIETYYIININCYDGHPNTPVEHYYDDNAVVHSDPASVLNPFTYLDGLLYSTPIAEMKENIKTLFEYAHSNTSYQEDIPCRLVGIQGHVNALIETAYLITRSAYIPEEWLKPETWRRFDNYVRPEIETVKPEFLSKREQKKPYKAIKKELRDISMFTGTIDDWLYNAFDPNKKVGDEYDYYHKINKVVEAIYIIYYDLLSKEQVDDTNKEFKKC